MKHYSPKIVPMDCKVSQDNRLSYLVLTFVAATGLGAVVLEKSGVFKDDVSNAPQIAAALPVTDKWGKCIQDAADKVSAQNLPASQSAEKWNRLANQCQKFIPQNPA